MITKGEDGPHAPSAFSDFSKGIPRVGPTRVDPVVRAVGRKLMHATMYSASGQFGQRKTVNIDHSGLFRRISDKTAGSIVDCRNAMQMLPDLDIAMNLMVSSILAPKDLTTTEITYSLRNKVVRSEVAQPLLEIIRKHFESHHKLKEDLEPILKDALFRTGSYPVLILAENTVDRIINGDSGVTLESFRGEMEGNDFKHIGFLGNPKPPEEKETTSTDAFGLEGFSTSFAPKEKYSAKSQMLADLSVTDNPNVLKVSLIRDRMRADKVHAMMHRTGIRTTMESMNPADELIQTLYRPRTFTPELQSSLPTTGAAGRKTVGHPLVMKLPSESVIPVHEPSNPSKHLGYFILIDPATGSPVYKSTEEDYYRDMALNYGANKTMASSILREAKRINEGLSGLEINTTDVNRLEQLYGDVLEYELNNRLKRGVYGSGATVARPEEIYRVMCARALAGKMTQLLYVPEEMLVYYAFDYNQYGVGVSLLAKSIILAGQRANLSVAAVMAELKNAVARTILNIQLDEEDDDPTGTVEHIITEHAKLRRGSYPMFVAPPNDIVEWMQNAAVEIEVNGNTGYPSTKVAVTDTNSNKVVPNMELQKDLRDRHLWSFGIPPESVDAARGADFATSIVNNNLMLIKMVMRYQSDFTPFLEMFVRTYVLSDGILLEEMREVIRKAKRDPSTDGLQATVAAARDQIGGSKGDDVDRVIVDFLHDLQIDLPKPEGMKTQNLQEAFEKQKAFVDLALDAYISDAAIGNDLSGDIGQHTVALKDALSAMFMRRWLRENGAIPMLDELVEQGENGSPGLDVLAEVETHTSMLKINLRDYIVKCLRRKAADDAVLATVSDQTGAELGGGGGGGDLSSDTGGDGGGDGGDPFGDMGDMGGEFEVDAADTDADADAAGTGDESEESSSTSTETSEDGTTKTTQSSSSSSSSTG